jgi:hypothetical protein
VNEGIFFIELQNEYFSLSSTMGRIQYMKWKRREDGSITGSLNPEKESKQASKNPMNMYGWVRGEVGSRK